MSSRFPTSVLVPQAGYPYGGVAGRGSFDPAMGRGYRAGDQIIVPAGAVGQTVVNHGLVDHYFRWKLMASVDSAAGATISPATAYYLTLRAVAKNENDDIVHLVQIPLGGAQIVYAPGRTLTVLVDNPTDQPLTLHYNLDEATPGLSPYTSAASITGSAGTETDLNIPTFCSSLIMCGVSGGIGWTLRGYDLTGALVYSEVLPVPRSSTIPLLPTLQYTIEPVAGVGQVAQFLYQCLG